jgi:hypothetical protein
MAIRLRPYFGAFAAVFAVAMAVRAQYAPPPPPPPAAKPPAESAPGTLPERSSSLQYGTPPFNYPTSKAVEPHTGNPPPPPPLARPPVADLTPPEFANHPVTTTCDGCRACDNPAAWLFTAEYMLVRPRRRADDYAIVDPLDNLTPEGRINNIGFDFASGLRAGIGYREAGSLWETWFTYTYLHAGGDAASVAPTGGLIYPTLTRPGLVDTALVAAGGNSLTYNVYDMDTVRRVTGDETFCLRLGFGVRYTNIDLNQQAFYNGRDANDTFVRSRISFDGAGPTVGGEGRWQMPWGLSLFGRAKGGLIVGDMRNSLRETDNGGLTTNANLVEHYYTTIPVLEFGTGVAWEYRNLRVAVGYEVSNWFNMIDTPSLTNDFAEGKIGRRRGDLSLEGLFLQLGMAY